MQDFTSLHAVVSQWKPSETENKGFHQQVIRPRHTWDRWLHMYKYIHMYKLLNLIGMVTTLLWQLTR